MTAGSDLEASRDFRLGLPARERTLRRVPESGILKRSSAFLASLAHPSGKVGGRNSRGEDDDKNNYLKPSNGYALERSSSSRCIGLKGYFAALSRDDTDAQLRALQRSPSVQTLSIGSWKKKKKSVAVKKSVSFSSDTSFEEKRAPYRKPALHEVTIYHKGVLQGECDVGTRRDVKRARTFLAEFTNYLRYFRAHRVRNFLI